MAWALQYASEALKNDEDFVLAAVRQNAWALGYASDELTNNILFFWQVWRCLSLNDDDFRQEYVNEFLFKEVLKLSLSIAGATLGIVLLSGVIALPLPAIALLAVGACLASAGSLYSGHKLYQHGLGFFNTTEVNTKKDNQFEITLH